MINVDNFLIRGLVLLVTCDHGLDRPPVPVPYEEEGEGANGRRDEGKRVLPADVVELAPSLQLGRRRFVR